MSEALEILKKIGYDNDSITFTEKWIAKEVYKLVDIEKEDYHKEQLKKIIQKMDFELVEMEKIDETNEEWFNGYEKAKNHLLNK